MLKGHTGAVRSVSFSHDGYSLVTASDDKSVIVWSVPRRCYVYSLSQHTNWVRCARYGSVDLLSLFAAVHAWLGFSRVECVSIDGVFLTIHSCVSITNVRNIVNILLMLKSPQLFYNYTVKITCE